MLELDKRIVAFAELGKVLNEVAAANSTKTFEIPELQKLQTEIIEAKLYNGWFTEENVRRMVTEIAESLSLKNIEKWLAPYREYLEKPIIPKTIGVVMAGNIPMVGFHDMLSILISGNNLYAKLSSDDNRLLPAVVDILIKIEPQFKDHIKFTDGKLEKPDRQSPGIR